MQCRIGDDDDEYKLKEVDLSGQHSNRLTWLDFIEILWITVKCVFSCDFNSYKEQFYCDFDLDMGFIDLRRQIPKQIYKTACDTVGVSVNKLTNIKVRPSPVAICEW